MSILEMIPPLEKLIEATAEKEKERFFADVEKDFEGTEVLKALYELKEHSEDHFNHSLEVALIANMVGFMLDLDDQDLDDLTRSALSHDIGKIKIPINILEKVEPLTIEEREEMNRHTKYTREIFQKDINNENISLNLKQIIEVAMAISMKHHEFKNELEKRCPRQTSGLKNELEIETRYRRREDRGESEVRIEALGHILAIVDTTQAIVGKRSYNKDSEKMKVDEVVKIVEKEQILEIKNGYKDVLWATIVAMKESGKYFENESMNVDRIGHYLRYKGKNYRLT